jgi:hypothetical protein
VYRYVCTNSIQISGDNETKLAVECGLIGSADHYHILLHVLNGKQADVVAESVVNTPSSTAMEWRANQNETARKGQLVELTIISYTRHYSARNRE